MHNKAAAAHQALLSQCYADSFSSWVEERAQRCCFLNIVYTASKYIRAVRIFRQTLQAQLLNWLWRIINISVRIFYRLLFHTANKYHEICKTNNAYIQLTSTVSVAAARCGLFLFAKDFYWFPETVKTGRCSLFDKYTIYSCFKYIC